MLKGETPSKDAARLADVDFTTRRTWQQCLKLAARVTGTEANLHGAIVTALSTRGPCPWRRGRRRDENVYEIGSADKAAGYVKASAQRAKL